MQRVDNYGAGFLRAGAKVVFAEAINSVSHQIRGLFTSSSNDEHDLHDPSERERGPRLLLQLVAHVRQRAHMDPPQRGKYWRSIVGNLSLLATQWRASAR